MITIEKQAKTVEEAVKEGILQLGMTEDEVDVAVISEGSETEMAMVKISTKWTEEDGICDYICGLLDRMDLDCSLDIAPSEKGYEVTISGPDSNYAIGYRGETLDAIQYLSLINCNKDRETFTKISIDAEGYRERREKTLVDLANRLADKAVRTASSVDLEPMTPYERRIVHEALADNQGVTTFSTGVEPARFITIEPKFPEKNYGTQASFRQNGIKTRSFGEKGRRF